MADTDFYTTKPQRLGSQHVSPHHANSSQFSTYFLYKAIIVAVFLVLLPLFPSQAPEFINQTLHTRSWEILQLIFVGIAVSYGLFSKRNDETEKEHSSSKFDNAQSYVSRLLQVSSVFDDEAENPSGLDENKVQTWNSQYYRVEPAVVVAQESSVLQEQSGTSSRIGEKPLLLPVRRLKSRISDSDASELSNEFSVKTGSLSRSTSNSGSKRFSSNSNKSSNVESGGSSPLDLLDKKIEDENVVLRSPIPWRSRSGRMQMKEDGDGPPLYSLPPSDADSEFNLLESRSFRSQSSRSSRPNSTSPSPKKPSPSPSLTSESQSKIVEDLVRKKSYHKVSSPPPPPPPPPHLVRKPPLVKSNPSVPNNHVFSEKKLKRSVRSVPMESSESDNEELPITANSGSDLRPRNPHNDDSLVGKSVRSIRPGGSEAVVGGREIDKFSALPAVSKQTFPKEFVEKVLVESDDDLESEEDDYFDGNSSYEQVSSGSVSEMAGPDVDKKADEFIAKFREQIRLQRIASIRRSTEQISRNSSRR